jgi:hypothetical protein
MPKRKPTLNLDKEPKRASPPFAVRMVPPAEINDVTFGEAIAQPNNDCALAAKRKPKVSDGMVVVKKDLPFTLASTPLPPPSPEAYPGPPVLKSIPESEYVNVEAPLSEEAKAQQIFRINYAATYGKVSSEEANAAFDDHTHKIVHSTELSKDADARIKMARTQTQWPNSIHVGLIIAEIALFITLYIVRDGLLMHWYF